MIFDMEANGLNPDRIHVLSYEKKGKIYSTFNYNKMRKILTEASTLIGHNIIRFDIPALEKILKIEIKARLIDTLSLSWYLEPERRLHGLESWGEDFGVPKPVITDWDSLTPEEYEHRCEEDVRINSKLWKKLWRKLLRLYGQQEDADRLIDYLTFKLDCAREQERSGWRVDIGRCERGVKELSEDYDKRYAQLFEAMPKVPKIVARHKPSKPYKMDGTLSAAGMRWFNLCESQGVKSDGHVQTLKEVVGHVDPNPSSVPQVKAWLEDLGWKPRTFKYKRESDGNFKKIPQIKNSDGDGLCPSVLELKDKCEAIEALDGMAVISHRRAILLGFLKDADDEGYIQAQIGGLTNTLRFKHRVAVNLPGVSRPYGGLIRGCLIAPDGYELCGSDMKGLEDRTKQHYMWPHDPEYVKEMLSEDFDPHLDIGLVAGMMSKDQVEGYKSGDELLKKKLGPVRHDAKQVNYSCTYGVTPEGLVRNCGWPLSKAQTLHKTYWKRNWALRAIADECKVKTCGGGKWLYNPVSKFWYSLRSDKDRFSTLNQGTGVYCFDTWVKFIRSKRSQMTAQFHDEVVMCIKKGARDKCEALLKWAIKKTNETLQLDRELDVSLDFGDSYAEIH
jgi:hypothetical protein